MTACQHRLSSKQGWGISFNANLLSYSRQPSVLQSLGRSTFTSQGKNKNKTLISLNICLLLLYNFIILLKPWIQKGTQSQMYSQIKFGILGALNLSQYYGFLNNFCIYFFPSVFHSLLLSFFVFNQSSFINSSSCLGYMMQKNIHSLLSILRNKHSDGIAFLNDP